MVAGILALVWPGITLLVLVVLLGIDLLQLAIALLAGSFAVEGEPVGRALAAVTGILDVLAGTSSFLHPLRTLPTIAAVIGVFWVVGGVAEVVSSLF